MRSPLRIAVVSTRDLAAPAGRPQILSSIIHALTQSNDVGVYRLRNIFEVRGLLDIVAAFLAWLWSVICLRPLPLQCLLYASPQACALLADQICDGEYDAVYLDTVRCLFLLRALRRLAPRLHVVTDFDDLMSRRMEELSKNRLPLLAGHVADLLPRVLRLLAEGPLTRLITAYEAAALRNAEAEIAAKSNAAVLLSSTECELMRLRQPSRSRLQAIPPAIEIHAEPWKPTKHLRFVFIGSDKFLQNRLAIDLLVNKWRALRPSASLHIYGRQLRPTPQVRGVHWHGFVDDLSDVYQAGSILLLPALLAGGIKTKVAEAWSWGCPVLGNRTAFESLMIDNYPLVLPDDEWGPLITASAAYMALWLGAARQGQDFVRRRLSVEDFERAWQDVMRPRSATVIPLQSRLAGATISDDR